MKRVEKMERWQTFLMGAAATVAVGWAVFKGIIPFLTAIIGW